MSSRRISFRKSPAEAPAEPAPVVEAASVVGKGRPTPKRSEAQKRRGPVAPPPATRREAAKRMRAEQAEERRGVRAASVTGDQRKMLPRDAGPVRAMARDLVDSRRNLAVLMLPFAVAVLAVRLLGNQRLTDFLTSVWTLTLLLVVADLVVLAVLLRRQLRTAFPQEPSMRGHIGYALMRCTTFRRLRMPPPRVRPAGLFGR